MTAFATTMTVMVIIRRLQQITVYYGKQDAHFNDGGGDGDDDDGVGLGLTMSYASPTTSASKLSIMRGNPSRISSPCSSSSRGAGGGGGGVVVRCFLPLFLVVLL